jgi:hypothetical protein
MSDCSWLSDRMPAVALGRAEWTTDEARHLSGCRSCQDEWEVVRTASRLGETSGLSTDAFTTSRAVLHRLSQGREERLRRRAWSFAGLAAAAALAAVVWIERPATGPVESAAASLEIPLPELDSLQPAELDSVLHTMDEPIAGSTLDVPDLRELDSDELQRVLDSWEG